MQIENYAMFGHLGPYQFKIGFFTLLGNIEDISKKLTINFMNDDHQLIMKFNPHHPPELCDCFESHEAAISAFDHPWKEIFFPC